MEKAFPSEVSDHNTQAVHDKVFHQAPLSLPLHLISVLEKIVMVVENRLPRVMIFSYTERVRNKSTEKKIRYPAGIRESLIWNLAEASRQWCLCSLSSIPLPGVQVA